MLRRPPSSTPTTTLFPYPTLFPSPYGRRNLAIHPTGANPFGTICGNVGTWRAIRREIAPGRGVGRYERKASTSLRLRSEEHTSELQSLMRISYAVFCLKKKIKIREVEV